MENESVVDEYVTLIVCVLCMSVYESTMKVEHCFLDCRCILCSLYGVKYLIDGNKTMITIVCDMSCYDTDWS